MKNEAFEDLFQEMLEELCDAEGQIVQAVPTMIAGCFSKDLSAALQAHLEETKQQLHRLESIFELTGVESSGRECKAMHALLNEGEQAMDNLKRSAVRDIALIAAAQKVEHYEMAAYGSACALAELLGQQELFKILDGIRAEEKTASDTLAEVANAILDGDSGKAQDVNRGLAGSAN